MYTVTGHGVFGCDHVATVVVVKVEIVPVLTDEDGHPQTSGGLPILGDPLDVAEEGTSTYCPDPGTERGALTIETSSHPEIWVQLTEQSDGSSAVLSMTHPEQERFAQWSLARDYSAELTRRYFVSGSAGYVVAERSLSADGETGFYDLTVYLKDEPYAGTTNEYTMPFQVYAPAGDYRYSNYQLSGPPANMGLPPYSDRNLFVFGIQGIDPATMGDLQLEAEVEDDYETQTLPFTNVIGGKLCSDVVVPLLNVDKDRDLGLEGVIRKAYRVHFQKGPDVPEVSEVRYSINAVVGTSGKKIADGKIPVKKAWLLTALLSDEINGGARVDYLGEGGETVVRNLGYEATLSVTPTKEQILDLLPRHRHWLHSGHGSYELGITFIKKDGTTYKRTELTDADIAGLGLTYQLVFMNTCESTDTYYQWVITNAFTHAGYYKPPVNKTIHKVYDIGKALNALNYVGWDCDTLRLVAINASKLFPQKLNGGRTVPQAVALTQDALDGFDDEQEGNHLLLRAVRSDGSKLDLKR